jgi:medium-chain acyl-[acyl-carrier-protein] hydrolase
MEPVLVDVPEWVPGRPTLVCVPHAGAGLGLFSRWRSQVEPVANLVIARLPGREDLFHEDPLETVEAMVDRIAPEMAARALEDYVLFGHCTGGLVAYELAQRLRRDGISPPRALVVSSTPAPNSMLVEGQMHGLPDEELKAYMVRFGNGSVDDVPDELWELVEPMIRADFKAAEVATYSTEPLDVPIVVFRATNDDLIAAGNEVRWRDFTRAGYRVVMFPATHFLIDTCATEAVDQLLAVATDGDVRG